MRKICVIFSLILLSAPVLRAQISGDIGITGGYMYYIGELNPGMPFRMAKPAFGAFYRQNFNNRLAVRVQGLYGSVAGDDLVSKADTFRALNFNSTLIEIGTQFEVNFFEFNLGSKQHAVSPYIFGGPSIFLFNPKNRLGVPLNPLRTEGQLVAYKKYGLSIPFGVGVKYSISRLFGLGAEWGMRKTFTDYIDDVSTVYATVPGLNNPTMVLKPYPPDPKQLPFDPSQSYAAGMQRGNSRNNDWYSYAGLSLTVKILMLKKERCLEFQNRYIKNKKSLD